MHRWLRVLICLLLVSCILLNLSPLKAEAVSATAVSLAVGIPVAVAVGLNALGVRQGSSSSVFNQVVSDAVDALSAEWAVNGLITMLALTTDGLTKTLASRNFLQALLDFIHNSGTVKVDDGFANSHYVSFPAFTGTFAAESPFFAGYYLFRGNYTVMFYSTAKQYAYGTSSSGSTLDFPIKSGPFNGYYCGSASNAWRDPSAFSGLTYLGDITGLVSDSAATLTQLSYILNNIAPGVTSYFTDEDLTLESVGHDIDTDYETYVDTGIVGVDFGVQFEDDPNTNRNEEDDGNDLWLPVGIPGQLSGGSYIDQTQQDAQSGDTPQDVLDQLLNQGGSGSDTPGSNTGGNSGNTGNTNSSWKPPSNHNQFALGDLSKFFPFCIPFDLYDFFTLLNADPVAPVLSWEIQDLSGQTYALSVDLSEWDSVAQLFRRLQLFLFICGLAAASRKYIKW